MATEDYGCLLKGVMWSQAVLAAIFIGMRLYTRHAILKNLGADDILMIVNLVTFIGFAASITVGIHYGIGRQSSVLSPEDYSKAIMWEAIGQAICTMGVAASKSLVAVFLLRIVVSRRHKAVLWFCIVTTTLWSTVTTTLLFVQCRPSAYLWDWTIEGGYCWLNFTRVAISMGAWSAAMDFILALLPWQMLYTLNMKRKDKLTVAIGLSLGIFAGISSTLRIHALTSLTSLSNYTSDTVPTLLWSATEICTSILCACIPILRPLYLRIVRGAECAGGGRGRTYTYPLAERKSEGRGVRGVSDGEGMVYTCAGMEAEVEVGLRSHVSEESIMREDKVPVNSVDREEIRSTSEVVMNVERGVEGGEYVWASEN